MGGWGSQVLEILLLLLILFVPGFIATRNLKLEFWERTIYAVILSLGISSFTLYLLSFFTRVSPLIIWAYVACLVSLLFACRKNIQEYVKTFDKEGLKNRDPFFWAVFLPMISIVVFAAYTVSNGPPLYPDEYTYHLPIINEFAENGQISTFENPINAYQHISNQLPFLFESFAGFLKMFFLKPFWKFLSPLAMLLAGGALYYTTKSVSQRTLLPPIFWILSPIVLIFGLGYLVDVFLSFAFFCSVLFLSKNFETKEHRYIYFAGFFAGITILTKLMGGVLALILLLFLVAEKRYPQSLKFFAATFLTSLIFFTKKVLVEPSISSLTLQENFEVYGFLIKLTEALGQLPVLFLSRLYLMPIILGLIPLSLWLRKKGLKRIQVLCYIGFWVFVLIVSAVPGTRTEGAFPRYFIPILGLFSLAAGITFETILEKIKKRKKKVLAGLLLIFLLFSLTTYSGLALNIFRMQEETEEKYGLFSKNIPNDSSSLVLVLNGRGFIYGLEKVTYYDHLSSLEYYRPACDFLRENKISHVVYHHPHTMPWSVPKEFGEDLKQALDKNVCSQPVGSYSTWVTIYKVI